MHIYISDIYSVSFGCQIVETEDVAVCIDSKVPMDRTVVDIHLFYIFVHSIYILFHIFVHFLLVQRRLCIQLYIYFICVYTRR